MRFVVLLLNKLLASFPGLWFSFQHSELSRRYLPKLPCERWAVKHSHYYSFSITVFLKTVLISFSLLPTDFSIA